MFHYLPALRTRAIAGVANLAPCRRTGADSSQHVVYRATNGHLHDLSWATPMQRWFTR
jgi:hypothetical protein